MINKRFLNYALITILTIVFACAATLPAGLAAVLISLVLTAILGYTATKYHYGFVVFCSVLIFAVQTLFLKNFTLSITTSLPIILCGLSLGICYNLRMSDFKTVCIVTGIFTLYIVLNMKISGIGENMQTALMSTLDTLAPMYEDYMSAADFKTLSSAVMTVFIQYMPSFLLIYCICYALLLFWIFKKVLKISKTDVSFYDAFSQWHADRALSVVFVVVALVGFLMPPGDIFTDAVANTVAVMAFIFFIFGLAYINSILIKRIKSAFSVKVVMALLTLISVFSFGIPFMLLSILGVADGFFDYRERFKK